MPTCVRLTYHSTRLSYSQVRHRFIQRQGHQLTLTSIALVLKTLVIESLPPHSEKFMGGVFKQMEMDLIVEVIQCLWSKQEANESRRQHSKVILVCFLLNVSSCTLNDWVERTFVMPMPSVAERANGQHQFSWKNSSMWRLAPDCFHKV